MGLFLIIALLVIVSAVYSYLNARFIKLPGTIGIITIAIVVSVITIAIDKLDPDTAHYLTILAKNINFSGTVLDIMLGFLLFAGSFNSNTKSLKKEMRPVFVLSTISIILSTVIFATFFYYTGALFHIHLPFIWRIDIANRPDCCGRHYKNLQTSAKPGNYYFRRIFV